MLESFLHSTSWTVFSLLFWAVMSGLWVLAVPRTQKAAGIGSKISYFSAQTQLLSSLFLQRDGCGASCCSNSSSILLPESMPVRMWQGGVTGKRTNEPAALSIGSQPWKAINHPGYKLPWLPKERQKPSTQRTYYFPNDSLHLQENYTFLQTLSVLELMLPLTDPYLKKMPSGSAAGTGSVALQGCPSASIIRRK